MLNEKSINVACLSEIDCLIVDEDFKFNYYKTYMHDRESPKTKTRLIALIKEEIENNLKQILDLQVQNYHHFFRT